MHRTAPHRAVPSDFRSCIHADIRTPTLMKHKWQFQTQQRRINTPELSLETETSSEVAENLQESFIFITRLYTNIFYKNFYLILAKNHFSYQFSKKNSAVIRPLVAELRGTVTPQTYNNPPFSRAIKKKRAN